jgi:hypothetical protein
MTAVYDAGQSSVGDHVAITGNKEMAMTVRRLLGILIAGMIMLTATRIAGAANSGRGDFEAVRQILATIPSGQRALQTMEQTGASVAFKSGQGTYFMASSNSIVIDEKHSPMRAALSFVHEIHHAQTYHEGARADIELSASEYVDLRVEEEAEGVVESIEAKMELAAAGWDVSQLRYPLEKAYLAAYESAKKAGQGLNEAELEQAARRAGQAAVLEGFMTGKVTTSQTGESYSDYYEGCWDKAETAGKLLGSVSETLLSTVTQMVAESC